MVSMDEQSNSTAACSSSFNMLTLGTVILAVLICVALIIVRVNVLVNLSLIIGLIILTFSQNNRMRVNSVAE